MEYKWSDRLAKLEGNAIREIFKLLAKPEIISFAGGLPAKEGIATDIMNKLATELLQGEEGYKLLQYGATEGWAPLFESGADYLRKTGIEGATKESMLLISGGQQGIDLTMKAFINKGDCILVEKPTYLAAIHIAKTYEAKIVMVESDATGIDVEDLEAKIVAHNPKLVYLVPTFSNPTGKTIGVEKRKKIAEVTAKYQVMLLEDDPYSKIRFEGEEVPPIKAFDVTGNVLYNTSFSKTVAPGIRVGIIHGAPEVIRKLTIGKQATDVHTVSLTQAMVDKYLRGGYMDKVLDEVKPIYKAKKDAMIAAIERYFPSCVKYTNPEGGLFIWCELPEGTDAKALLLKAIDVNVAYVVGDAFFADGSGKNTFRLNYSNATMEQIDTGINRLGNILKENLEK